MSVRPVCPPDHKHGANTTCYTGHRCGCHECKQANTDRAARATRLQAYGRWLNARMNPEPVAEHVRHLMEFGYSYQQIAAAAGINEGTPYKLAHGKLKFVFGRVGHGILAIHPNIDDLGPHTLIPSRGVQRRIQALATNGWCIQAIATRLGLSRATLSHTIWRTHVEVRTHRAIADAYEQLWNTEPPRTGQYADRTIRKTIDHADRLGWLPPLAWDDIDNDPEPPAGEAAGIDEIAIALAVHGERVKLTREERHIAVTTLNRDRGYDDQVIASMLLVSDKTIGRDREFLGLPAAVGPDKQRIAS